MLELRPWSRLAAALAALAAFACEKASGPDPSPLPAPPEAVVVIVSTGSLVKATGAIRAYGEAVRPGSGLFVREEMVADGLAKLAGAESLDGLDLAGPVHLIVLDGPARRVVVGKAANRAALDKGRGGAHLVVRDGWALVGPKDAVELVASWAVPGLVATRPARALEATVHIDRLMTRHAAEVTAIRESAASQMSAADPTGAAMTVEYMTALFKLAGDSARLVVALSIDAERADLDLALVPRTSSPLAGFIAAQKPSDFALLESLPATAPTGMVMAGHLELGPYRQSAIALFTRMMNFGDTGTDFGRAFTALADLATGDFAAGFTMGPAGASMVEILPVSDAVAAEKVVREVAVATAAGVTVTAMGIRMTHTGHADLAQHGGTVIHGLTTTVDLDSTPPLQRDMFARMYGNGGQRTSIAFPPGALIATIGELGLIEQAIDARAGKAARLRPPPEIAGQVVEARGRRDSLLFVIDLVSIVGTLRAVAVPGAPPPPPAAPAPGLAIALGFADRAAHLRFTLSAATVRALAAAAPQ